MHVVTRLDAWFTERLRTLDCSPETIAYVAGVLKAQAHPRHSEDLSNESIVVAYSAARSSGDFVSYQRLGDWVLFVDIAMPGSMGNQRDLIEVVGRLSYSACYRLVNRQWPVFDELSDRLPVLADAARTLLT